MNLTGLHLFWNMEKVSFESQDGDSAHLSHELVKLLDAFLMTMGDSDSYRVLGQAFNSLVLNATLRDMFNDAVHNFIAQEPTP